MIPFILGALAAVGLSELSKKGKLPKMASGGGVDLFEDYENIPPKVQRILDKYQDGFEDGDYAELSKALKELEKIGYTFEYYLDGQAYDLRPIGTKGKMEEYATGGGVGLSKDDIEILGVPRSKISEKEWQSILRMAKYQDAATFILKDEKGLDVVPQTEYEWYIKEKYAKGGSIKENLEKELKRLQRDLNSPRLRTYKEGDTSEEEMARQREREVKLARFNEVLGLLREMDSKFAIGGKIPTAPNGEEFAKGGKLWIQDALKGSKKGSLKKKALKKGLIRNMDEKLSQTDLDKLQKMGGKTAKQAYLAETLNKLK